MIDDKPGQGDALGDRLAERMDVLGLSVEDLRERMGRLVTTGSIYAWRRGERTVRHDNLRALAIAIDVSTDYLVGLTDDPTPRPRKSSDPAEAEARRYERAVRALAGEKRRLKARYSDEWVKSGDEGRPVSDTPGSDGESRFYRALRRGGPVPSVEPFVRDLRQIGHEPVRRLISSIPSDWVFAGMDAAWHVEHIANRADEFAEEMERRVVKWQNKAPSTARRRRPGKRQ